MRKTTIAAITLALIAAPVGAQSFSASAMKAERDRMEAGEGIRFMDAVPTWGHAARKKANEDLYRQQVQEAQQSRYSVSDRDLDRVRAMASESRARLHEHMEHRLERSRERLEDLSKRPPPRRPRPPR